MRTTNRNRPNHRSTAVSLVILFIIAAACGVSVVSATNTAQYTVAENGSVVYANLSFSDLDTVYIVDPGFFGTDTAVAEITDFSLTNSTGGSVVPQMGLNGAFTFPKGNYTLQYTVPVSDSQLYLRYAAPFDVAVVLPYPYTTGHMVLGQPGKGGTIVHAGREIGDSTLVTFTGVTSATVSFYDIIKEPILYFFAGGWVVIQSV